MLVNKREERTPGKKIGHNLYIHKTAVPAVDFRYEMLVDIAKEHLPASFQYEVVKVNLKDESVSFIDSPDWNESLEPIVGDSIKVYRNGLTTFRKGRESNPQIYHHKWLMVTDHYPFFDVEEAKLRSTWWERKFEKLNLDRKKIGNADYWNKCLDLMTEDEGKKVEPDYNAIRVDRTSLNQIPALFKNKKVQIGQVNLDIGGGKFEKGSEYLADKGVENLIYDTYVRNYEHNKQVIERLRYLPSDTVTIANVLNVVRDKEERAGILAHAARSVRDDGTCYIQIYEGNKTSTPTLTTRQTWQENRKTETYMAEIEPFFNTIKRFGNILACTDAKKDISPSLLEKQGRQWRLEENVFIVESQHNLFK